MAFEAMAAPTAVAPAMAATAHNQQCRGVVTADAQVQCLLHRRILCCCWWCCCGSSSCTFYDSLTVPYLDRLTGPMKPSSARFRLLSPRLAYWLVSQYCCPCCLSCRGEPLGSRGQSYRSKWLHLVKSRQLDRVSLGAVCHTCKLLSIQPGIQRHPRVQSPIDPSSHAHCSRMTSKCVGRKQMRHWHPPTRLPYSWSRSTKACLTTPQEGPATHQDAIKTSRLALIS